MVEAASRALYSAVAVTAPELDSPSPATLRERANSHQDPDLAAAADALDALDGARFSAEANPAEGPDARAALERLRSRSRRRSAR